MLEEHSDRKVDQRVFCIEVGEDLAVQHIYKVLLATATPALVCELVVFRHPQKKFFGVLPSCAIPEEPTTT